MRIEHHSNLRYAGVHYNAIDPKKIGVKACEAMDACIEGDGDVEGVSGLPGLMIDD